MRLISLMFVSVGVIVLIWLFPVISEGWTEDSPFLATVVKVIDGDTIEVRREKTCRRIRLWGIDSPEWNQPYGLQSTQYTESLLNGKDVTVVPMDQDKYGRLVAMVMVGRKNIGEELVASGAAWVDRYFCREKICDAWSALQERAASEGLGLWKEGRPVPPWRWRRDHRR